MYKAREVRKVLRIALPPTRANVGPAGKDAAAWPAPIARDDRPVLPDADSCYRAVLRRESRFDGWFVTAVTSTGIYCRPACPSLPRRRRDLRFYPTGAAALLDGFRACHRCRPDVTPGSPAWSSRGDLVARAMRLIADGVVERDGVAGLAARLGVSSRHLHRLVVAEVGAGPADLARAQRAETARVLIETTALPFTQVALAAGLASVRQLDDSVRAVFGTTPSARRGGSQSSAAADGAVHLRLPHRLPYAAEPLLAFLADRAVAGIEEVVDGAYRRTLRLPHGPASWSCAQPVTT